jgi:hypothetical protein
MEVTQESSLMADYGTNKVQLSGYVTRDQLSLPE